MVVSFVIPIRFDQRLKQSINRLNDFISNECLIAEIIICGEIIPNQDIQNIKYVPVIPALKGECVCQGIKHCKGKVIVVCDADIPVDYKSLKEIINAVNSNDVAFGHRFLKESSIVNAPSLYRRVLSRAFRLLVEIVFKIHGVDTQCGLKAFRSDVANDIFSKVHIRGLTYDIDVYLTAKRLGAKVCSVPVNWTHYKSTIKVRKVAVSVLREIILLKKNWDKIIKSKKIY